MFEYCETKKFREAFQFNDYVIVQVDTDVLEEKHYDIPKYEKGKDLSPEQLIDRVTKKLSGLIGNTFYQQYKERMLFAIAVHSTECWLLPLYYMDKKRQANTKNCLKALNRHPKMEKTKINPKDKNPDIYEAISGKYCKHKTLMALYKKNPSLQIFVEDVEKRKIIIDEDNF